MSNGRQMTRVRPMAAVQQAPSPARQMSPSQQGWSWNGSQWVCDPCDDFPPCPPFPGFPPALDPATSPWYPGANAGVSFGATAPNFPIRGNFWWDGKTLWMFDGAAWVIVGGNSGAPPLGVTDGSNAPAGYVGEFYNNLTTGNVPTTMGFTQTINAGVLQPGDWTVQAWMFTSALVSGLTFLLNPIPTGVTHNMAAVEGMEVSASQGGMFTGTIGSDPARANLVVPTLFVFTLVTNNVGTTGAVAPVAGTWQFGLQARRVR